MNRAPSPATRQSAVLVGLDIGSTTVKAVVLDTDDSVLYREYRRHGARQREVVSAILSEVEALIAERGLSVPGDLRVSVCGSGGEKIAAALGAFYAQEVVANAVAVRHHHPAARTAIELGGQDAKVIIFESDPLTGEPTPGDLRMNGVCAGGTGAFLDQMARLIGFPVEDFDALARGGHRVYEISGRCGVFAKTDIQPLLNQGVSREDIALSALHAVAKQTIGGLAQGVRIAGPVIFEGGPLTFVPRLVEVFAERLELGPRDILIPHHPETLVAEGAALSGAELFGDRPSEYRGRAALDRPVPATADIRSSVAASLFADDDSRAAFFARHGGRAAQADHAGAVDAGHPPEGGFHREPGPVACAVGIDAGSTTTKIAVIDDAGRLVDSYYGPNRGEPLRVAREALLEILDRAREAGRPLKVAAVGTTGYGEKLFARAFAADYHTVETVAHAEASRRFLTDRYGEDAPKNYLILDIGGQDMKAITVRNGVVTTITLNEACSAGCGSFLESYTESLGIPVDRIAELAFSSQAPSRLGSRCTVFMNSSIITEQKNGKSTEDILAGLCRSVVENVFTKVIRLRNTAELGDAVVAQGGTLKNNAVLRALEEYTGLPVIRPDEPGLMGAIGVAHLARAAHPEGPSSFVGREGLADFSYQSREGVICRGCLNNCSRTIISFSGGRSFVTGNRCERGELETDTASRKDSGPFVLHNRLLTKSFLPVTRDDRPRNRIGIPRVLEFWQSLPFWKAVFESVGFDVVISRASTPQLFERGLASVLSDTVCLPAKVVHGHIIDLIEKGAGRIFFPSMLRTPKDNPRHAGAEVCPIVQGYPIVTDISDETRGRFGVPMDRPTFHFFDEACRRDQTIDFLTDTYGIGREAARQAVKDGEAALALFETELHEYGRRVKDSLGPDDFAVVIAGRPYHADGFVNHDIASHFERLGVPVLSLATLPEARDHGLHHSRLETYNTFHTRVLAAARTVAEDPRLELVQIVSFGCGHDALLSDEMARVLKEGADKEPLILKLDEGDAPGPLSIRIRSFVETVRSRRRDGSPAGGSAAKTPAPRPMSDSYPKKFLRRHRSKRVVYVPVLSEGFSRMSVEVLRSLGYRAEMLPPAGPRAVELGKKFVHNDICYPAQINVGEMLAHLESGKAKPSEACLGLAKNCIACRAGQYAGLARKALDDAGYADVRILTTGKDDKNIHPGFRPGTAFLLRMLVGLAAVDALEYMRRRIRPYELTTGTTDRVFNTELAKVARASTRSLRRTLAALKTSVDAFNRIVLATTERRPRVGILGEILMNYHEAANGYVERYLEAFGLEVVVPDMTEFFRRKNIVQRAMARRRLHPHPQLLGLLATTKELAYEYVHRRVEGVLARFRLYEPRSTVRQVVRHTKDVIDPSYLIGEGWLMPGEILEMAEHGVKSFLILNPFGCMPNHITGRGMIKEIKRRHPEVHVLALDYDPDTPWANIENRLQMLVMTAQGLHTTRHRSAQIHAALVSGARGAGNG